MNIALPKELTPEAQKFMDALINRLDAAGALEECDCGCLYMLANSFDCFVRTSEIVRKEGLVIVGLRGSYTEHPAAALMNKYNAQVLSMMKDIGGTIKSRQNIKSLTTEAEDDSPIYKFL